jgi:ORF6N domain.
MNNLKITGTQKFMDREILVVLGGFGEGKKCVSDKMVAEIHDIRARDVRETISRNRKRFMERVDFIDLKKGADEVGTLELLQNMGYAKQSISQANHIYLLSERGYAKLIKIMDSDLAWEIHDKLIDEYFNMRENQGKLNGLSPQLQLLINMEMSQREQAEKLEKLDSKIDSIRDVVALNPNDWRRESNKLINKIAEKLGGYEHISLIRSEMYALLDERFAVSLNARLRNKRLRAAEEGMCKSKREKMNQLDVIADDKKLIEGFIMIMKDMAIKYGLVA